MNSGSEGISNRLRYDVCAYEKQLYESISPMSFEMDLRKYENKNKCVDDKFWLKQDPELVDTESELQLRTRPASKCNQFQYNPKCNNEMCTSTFDPSNPKPIDPTLCPIVYNNIAKMTTPGFPSLSNVAAYGYSKTYCSA